MQLLDSMSNELWFWKHLPCSVYSYNNRLSLSKKTSAMNCRRVWTVCQFVNTWTLHLADFSTSYPWVLSMCSSVCYTSEKRTQLHKHLQRAQAGFIIVTEYHVVKTFMIQCDSKRNNGDSFIFSTCEIEQVFICKIISDTCTDDSCLVWTPESMMMVSLQNKGWSSHRLK